MFIETPTGNQVLIDGGPDASVIEKLSEIMPFYDRTIDLAVLTHPHADHLTGLIEVIKRYDVANILETEIIFNSPELDEWRNLVKQEGAEEIDSVAGKTIDIGGGAVLSVIYPFNLPGEVSAADLNDSSVVMILSYGDSKILFEGDAELYTESRLAMAGVNLSADILKAGHHGSAKSSSALFLEAVKPQVAVIEVGAKNRYGHPSQEVLSRMSENGIKYYRTDIDGDIKIISDGNNFSVSKINN